MEAGLTVDNGIVVDEFCRTSAEGVYAAGDVANHLHPVFGAHIRTEHWKNAIAHGEAAALNMLDRSTPYDEIPWFWSDQYEHNLQYAGFHTEWDDLLVRGSLAERDFVAFFVQSGKVRAALAMNRGSAMEEATALIRSGASAEQVEASEDTVRVGLASG